MQGRARSCDTGANSLRWAADLSEALTPSCTVTRMRAVASAPSLDVTRLRPECGGGEARWLAYSAARFKAGGCDPPRMP